MTSLCRLKISVFTLDPIFKKFTFSLSECITMISSAQFKREKIIQSCIYVISAKSSTLCTLMFNLSPRVNHKFSITGGVASLYIVTVSSNVLSNISTARTVMSALSPSDQTKFKYSDSSLIFRTDLNALESFTDEPSLTVYDTRKSTHPVIKT